MNILLWISALIISIVPQDAGEATQQKPLEVVSSIDLQRYVGTWHEIARFPNSFQRDCASDVTATYTLLEDGTIAVVNRCRQSNGETKEAVGKVRRMSKDEPNSKLEVRFAPAILSFLPFVWGKYWVIDLAADYSYAVVGEPSREYLWILARSPSLDETTYAGILDRIARRGYDTSRLMRAQP